MSTRHDGVFLAFSRSLTIVDTADIAVIGGGPAGIAAAISAARIGCRVYLIEQTGSLGGLGTSGLVPCFTTFTDGVNILVGGIGREVLERLRSRGGTGPDDSSNTWSWIPINSEVLKLVYDEMITESRIEIRLFTKLVAAECDRGRLDIAVLCGVEGMYGLKAKVFVDATGDATLSFFAGVPCKVGGEKGETQAPTLCSVFANVDWDKYRAFLKMTAQGGDLRQTLEKAISEGAFTVPDIHLPGAFRTGNKVASMNAGHIYGVNCTRDAEITSAMFQGRRVVQEFLDFYRRYVPGFENAELVSTAPLLGVRETRRIVGEYVLNLQDFLQRRSFPDEIGRYSYPIDIHPSSPSHEDFEAFERKFGKELRYANGESYGIPYRSLVPKGVENLFVAGRCISTDREMQGSTRVMPCCFITGQAAGTAAALCAKEGIPNTQLDYHILRRQLRKDGAYVP